MSSIEKQAKMEAFFYQHVLDHITSSLGISETKAANAVDYLTKVGRITKKDAAFLLNADKKQANRLVATLVDALKDVKKYKERVEEGEDDDESEPKKEIGENGYIEIHTPERDVSSTLPYSTFSVPAGNPLVSNTY